MRNDPFMPTEYYSRRAAEFLSAEASAGQDCSDLAGYDEETEEGWRRTLEAVTGRVTLDLGCGTGRWTEKLLAHCPAAIGIDNADGMLAASRARSHPERKGLYYLRGDLMSLTPQDFRATPSPEAAMARYIFSHIRRREISPWLESLARILPSGAPLVLIDNRIEERGRPLGPIPDSDDAYCLRTLADGSKWKIRKNYFEAKEVKAYLAPLCSRIETWQGHWTYCVIGWLA